MIKKGKMLLKKFNDNSSKYIVLLDFNSGIKIGNVNTQPFACVYEIEKDFFIIIHEDIGIMAYNYVFSNKSCVVMPGEDAPTYMHNILSSVRGKLESSGYFYVCHCWANRFKYWLLN